MTTKAKKTTKTSTKKVSDTTLTATQISQKNSLIKDAKSWIKDGYKKSECAVEVFDQMKKFPRKDIIEVFMDGCSLTKNGAATYHFNIKSKQK